MKRSELNRIIREGQEFIESFGFVLPPFAHWTIEDWRANRSRADSLIGAGLGWDITDYGRGNFHDLGLLLFTLRNGKAENLKSGTGMVYAEKIMISRKDQIAPMHFHKVKTEDIIVRGGAPLAVRLVNTLADGSPDNTMNVIVQMDGITHEVEPGGTVRIEPGASITLEPGQAHAFWGDGGDSLIGEVSTVNDDETDNYFFEPVARFPSVEDDEPAFRLIVPDYRNL